MNNYIISKLCSKVTGARYLFLVLFLLLCMVHPASARDWYVRPASGNYGAVNGTSYDNAWSGLPNVVWGAGGVQPGDTLWVCGLHLLEIVDRYSWNSRSIKLLSGTSDSTRVTIRGDYSSDPGVVWGAALLSPEKGTDYAQWVSEGNGVYSIVLPADVYAGEWVFQDIGLAGNKTGVLLEPTSSIEGVATPGSHYSSSYKAGSKLYVHCTDDKSPVGRIAVPWLGYLFSYSSLQYFTFKNITFFNPYRVPLNAAIANVRWENCKMYYGFHSILGIYGETNNIEIVNCELAWANNGIYFISEDITSTETINKTAKNYIIKGNYIHDIGVRPSTYNRDSHCIGIQGGENGVIEDNVCERTGSGPLLYAFTQQMLKNTTVRRNVVKNLFTSGGASGYGISTQCMNNSTSDKSGNKFYHNVVVDATVGYRMQFEYLQEVYNNIAVDCNVGFETTRNNNYIGSRVVFKNNILYNCATNINWVSGATDFMIQSDSNLFYPNSGKIFNLRGYLLTFAEWQNKLTQYPASLFDTHSISGQPMFTGSSYAKLQDFTPVANSPVIGRGIDVGLTTDALGKSIIKPDIGPIQYIISLGAPRDLRTVP